MEMFEVKIRQKTKEGNTNFLKINSQLLLKVLS